MTLTDIATAAVVVLGIVFMAVLAVAPLFLQREAERADAPAPVIPLSTTRPSTGRSLHAA